MALLTRCFFCKKEFVYPSAGGDYELNGAEYRYFTGEDLKGIPSERSFRYSCKECENKYDLPHVRFKLLLKQAADQLKL